jgi:hypothetical protein
MNSMTVTVPLIVLPIKERDLCEMVKEVPDPLHLLLRHLICFGEHKLDAKK